MAKLGIVTANLLILFVVAWVQFFVLSNPAQCAKNPEFLTSPISFFACNYWDGVQWGVYAFAVAAVLGLIVGFASSDEKKTREEKIFFSSKEEKTTHVEPDYEMQKAGLVPLRCTKCNTGNSPSARYCSRCGSQL
ncbi:zinc ribbon domain-containing protein [Candidatus Micrarchaeota archaeon]|nr:zinc ribbon domain-containing protein [Candidatus Micrarchaeota archaeon]